MKETIVLKRLSLLDVFGKKGGLSMVKSDRRNACDIITISNNNQDRDVYLFYEKGDNVFLDEDGYIIWDIFSLVTPNDLYLFRLHGEDMCVPHKTLPGVFCHLYHPLPF